jgi:hypothetical protein
LTLWHASQFHIFCSPRLNCHFFLWSGPSVLSTLALWSIFGLVLYSRFHRLLCLVCVAVEVASSGRASFRNLDVRLYNWTQFFSSYSWIAFCNSLKDVKSLSLKALSIMSLYMFSYYYNTSILQMYYLFLWLSMTCYVSIVQLDMTKNQLPFLFIIEIKQNPTNLFNNFIHKSYKDTSIIRL